MAHCQKIKVCDVKRVFDELNRTAEHYKNDVKPTFSELNYTLRYRALWGTDNFELRRDSVGVNSLLMLKFEERLSQLNFKKQKNTVGLCNWVISCPEEFKDDPEQQDRFFETVYSYTVNRYGVSNVLPGKVHNDESNPHIHIPVIPVVNENHLCAREFLTRKELSDYQKDLEAECFKTFGMKGLILNGRTKGDYTLEELKERTKDEEQLKIRESNIMQREREVAQMEQRAKDLLIALKKSSEEYKQLIEDVRAERRAEYQAKSNKLNLSVNEAIESFQSSKYEGDYGE